MNKFVIKNCPALYGCKYCIYKFGLYAGKRECKDINDCLLKRIVEIFKDFRKDSILINGNQILVEEILNLLEIEEVE